MNFDYELVRSKRRTLGISVADARVTVRAPLKAPRHWIEGFLTEKARWIEAKLSEQQHQLSEVYRIENGAILPILDQALTVVLHKGNRTQVQHRNDELHISAPHDTNGIIDQRRATEAFQRWIKRRAEQVMTVRTIELAQSAGLSTRLGEVRYRRTKTKWGHCAPDGTIQYNPMILLAPVFVVDYIIAHEVAHLKHANHSQRYWRYVDRLFDQREEAEQWLKQQGHKLAMTIA
mgnify:CR=1 FL=1